MNTIPDLETILKRAPRPVPPADLLATLERQIKLNPSTRPEPRASLWRGWRKIWMPLAGLAGTAAFALVIAAVWWFGTARTLAGSLKALEQMKSCHVKERFHARRERSIIIDKSKPEGAYPNYWSTDEHPDNPMVVLDHWFQLDPRDPSRPRLRTVSPGEDVWQQGNRVLAVNHKTGKRSLKLVNTPNNILATLGPMAGLLAHFPLKKITPQRETNARVDAATGLWMGESRMTDSTVPGADVILRVWLNPDNQLPARIQFLSTGFPQVAPEALMREYEFSEFNAAFPEKTFNFAITDQDLAPLGVTRAELDAMDDGAVSFEVTGESGAEVAGTVQDDAGTRRIQGSIPFSFVHDQHGNLKLDLHMVDGKRRDFRLRFNGGNLQAVTSGLKAKTSANKMSVSIWNVD